MQSATDLAFGKQDKYHFSSSSGNGGVGGLQYDCNPRPLNIRSFFHPIGVSDKQVCDHRFGCCRSGRIVFGVIG